MFKYLASTIILMAALSTQQASSALPKIVSVTDTEVSLLFDGELKPRNIQLSQLSAIDQEAIATWKKENQNTLLPSQPKPKPTSKREPEPIVYNPKASYGERQRTLRSIYATIPANFDDDWPKLVKSPDDIQVSLVEENEEERKYVYHSDHYEFICDVPLKPHLVQRFAVLFEGTREFCRQLPISTKKAHLQGQTHRNKILLFESKQTYVANGAPPSSAGVYMPGRDIVMVPLTSIGVRKVGSSYSVDYDGSNKTLPHELVHQLTDSFYYQHGARGWFSEGLAEYVAVTPYRSGKFILGKTVNAAEDYAVKFGRKGNGGRALGEEINAPSLKNFMLQPYSSFAGSNANFNYGLGLLITTYFFEMEGKGDRVAITAFLKALRKGKQGEEALAALRQGRTFDELAKDISKGWKSKGVKIHFAPSGE